MLDLRLYMLQRLTALVMAPLVLGHLAVMIYAIQGGLDADSVDLVFLCDTYHHLDSPQTMLSAIKTALRWTGRLVVVDRNTKGHAKFTMEEFKAQLDEAGFKLVDEQPAMTSKHFLMTFQER